jgi:predicted regulator of Ras-like GTPase activity (Roadblock/LC7/MglB family)
MSADAIHAWSDQLARDPRSLAFLPLAEELRKRRKLDDALRVALRGLERHPYLADAHDVLARVCADRGEEQRARDEWETALRLDPAHAGALRGLGHLALEAVDVGEAERRLARVLHGHPDDPTGDAGPTGEGGSNGRHAPTPPSPGRNGAHRARELFAAILGDGDRTALLVDRDGLVLAGTYVDASGRDLADEISAHLAGIGDESARALAHLGLGAWQGVLVEAQHATVALGPVPDGGVVLVAAALDTNVGLVRRLLEHARRRAAEWLKEPA